MKKLLFGVGALLIGLTIATGCTNEEVLEQNNLTVVKASIEAPAARTTVSEDYKVLWSESDAFTVFAGDSKKGDLTLQGTGGTTTEDFAGTLTPALASGDVAIFPAVTANTKAYTFPASYTTTETDAPLYGTYNGSMFSFKHLAAFIRVKANDLPAGSAVLTITSQTQALTGETTLTSGALSAPTGNGKTITVTFTATAGQDLVFDAPIPAQNYDKITLNLTVEGEQIIQKERALNAGVGKLYELTTTYTSATDIAAANTALQSVDSENKNAHVVVEEEVTGTTNAVAIPIVEGSIVTIDFADVADNAALQINSGSGTSGESQQQIAINVGNESTESAELTINTPTATVELGSGTFTTVTATTATNTLIIGEGVTINKLIVKGGNVVLKGNVKSIESEVATTIKLENDIESDEIITISGPITLDGNDKTLTSTAGRAINVSGANGVTIKNLTINASGERAINIIQNATNVTIDNVTATAANYTVNVASSAPSAIVKIVNSTLEGLCTVNVSSAGANVTIEKTKIVCNDQNANENYGALTLTADATNAKIIATETTFEIDGDSMQSNNTAEGGSISINGQEVVANPVAIITYPGPYYYSFLTLKDAIEYANAGETVTLIRDIEITESIEVNKVITIDLNGKTITISKEDEATTVTDFINKGTLTIKNGSITAGNDELTRRCIYNYGTMTIDGVNFTQQYGQKGAAINNEGTMTIQGNTTVNSVYYSIWNSGSNAQLTVNNGTFTCDNIDNVEYPCYCVNNLSGATLIVNDGAFTGNHGAIGLQDSGTTATLNKGTFKCTDVAGQTDHAISVLKGSTLKYNKTNCTIESADTSSLIYTENGGTVEEIN